MPWRRPYSGYRPAIAWGKHADIASGPSDGQRTGLPPATAGFLGLAEVQPAAAADAPIAQRAGGQVTADALPTVQINGVVWDQAVVGDTVYAGGQFTTPARPAPPPGTNETPRSNLLAYNIRTGALITSFAPTVNGSRQRARACRRTSTRLYVGGSFTTVNGVQRNRIAAFNIATGQLITSFAPEPRRRSGDRGHQHRGLRRRRLLPRTATPAPAGGLQLRRTAPCSPGRPTADSTVNALLLDPGRDQGHRRRAPSRTVNGPRPADWARRRRHRRAAALDRQHGGPQLRARRAAI